MAIKPFDLKKIQVFPLKTRKSLTRVEDILIDPQSPAPDLSDTRLDAQIELLAKKILEAQHRGSVIQLIYGAHLLRNGAALILEDMMARGWVTHLATNGAGTIHDWEYAFLGKSTESVRENVATGNFGAWEETGTAIHVALALGGIRGEGYGAALGRFILNDGGTFPSPESLERVLREEPGHPMAPARADLLVMMKQFGFQEGRFSYEHPWKHASILAQAARHQVPLTVHPGIGYDIVSVNPMFNGSIIGRAAQKDFQWFCGAVEGLDGGVTLSVGSAIMGPQVFEKSLSVVHNLRLQEKRPLVKDLTIGVVDLQDGGNWDWTHGEPPKTNPAYYLRFCKSYARMGGDMHYLQCDNADFIQCLYHRLLKLASDS